MHQPIILFLAKKDIRDAALWFNFRQRGLGKRFTAQVRDKVNFICQNPHAVAVRYDEVRTVVLDDFSFMLHYSVDDNQKQIIISAVLHTSRDTEDWKKRKKL